MSCGLGRKVKLDCQNIAQTGFPKFKLARIKRRDRERDGERATERKRETKRERDRERKKRKTYVQGHWV